MTVGNIGLTPLTTTSSKVEFFKETRDNTFNSIMESMTKKPAEKDDDWRDMSDKEWERLIKRVDYSTGIGEIEKPKALVTQRVFDGAEKIPYGGLIKDGVIEYNGVTLIPDYETNSICLGDCGQQAENDGKVISVPMTNGGFFKFNVDNIGDISGIIGMFSAEDAGRILNAIEQYNFTQSKLNEMEEEVFKTAAGKSVVE